MDGFEHMGPLRHILHYDYGLVENEREVIIDYMSDNVFRSKQSRKEGYGDFGVECETGFLA